MVNNVSLTMSSFLTIGVEISLRIGNINDTKVNMILAVINVTICPLFVVTGSIITLNVLMLPGYVKHGRRKLTGKDWQVSVLICWGHIWSSVN